MPPVLKVILVFVAVAIVLGGFYDFVMDRPSLLGFNQAQQGGDKVDAAQQHLATLEDVTLSAFALLLGIVFGSIYNRVRGREDKIHIGKELQETFQSSHFIISMLVAPLIFAGVYVAAKTQPDRVVAFLFAFQNGFFCDSIFRRDYANK